MFKKVKATIDKVGNLVFDAEGFTGGECLKATEKLEKALGGRLDRDEKPEMKLQGSNQQTQNLQNRL